MCSRWYADQWLHHDLGGVSVDQNEGKPTSKTVTTHVEVKTETKVERSPAKVPQPKVKLSLAVRSSWRSTVVLALALTTTWSVRSPCQT